MADRSRLNVLVVDSDEATVIDLKDFLAKEGYRAQSMTDPGSVVEEEEEDFTVEVMP